MILKVDNIMAARMDIDNSSVTYINGFAEVVPEPRNILQDSLKDPDNLVADMLTYVDEAGVKQRPDVRE
ncbi:hypothetical protein LTR48_008856, partial [Friedmanniomyces endolithicus]